MYVENEKLYVDICDWLERRKIDPTAKMGHYTQVAIINIANGLVKRWNFRDYTWTDEMALDAIEVCVRYLHNYDPKFKNAHAYITRTCFSACVNRIKKENRQIRTKYRYYLHAVPDIEEYDEDGNQIQVDYSFFKDIGDKLKEPVSKKGEVVEPDVDPGLTEFME